MKEIIYDKELEFLKKLIKQLNIPLSTPTLKHSVLSEVYLGLRHALGLEEQIVVDIDSFFDRSLQPNTILYVTDEFFCHYIIMLLPDTTKPTILLIGPYVTHEINEASIIELLQQKNISPQWVPILKQHIRNITCLSNNEGLTTIIHAFAEVLWGEENFTSEHYIYNLPDFLEPLAVPPNPQKRFDMFSNVALFEKLYADENQLMKAVSQGQTHKARNILNNIPLFAIEQRIEGIRNLKNHTIILNTLLRKSAEYGGVHPLYIDQLSSTLARRIEEFSHSDNLLDLWNEMVQKYCALVNKHTMKRYTLPVQKIITRIDFDLSADLSLKATAQYLNMSPNYLSSLFKSETGQNLTDYVNEKRMIHAAYLLTSTQMPVSTIAQSCGILDDNYFTKLFKRYMHKTPSKYRHDYFIERKN